jgi:MYXO-CTERM domain-containing protein
MAYDVIAGNGTFNGGEAAAASRQGGFPDPSSLVCALRHCAGQSSEKEVKAMKGLARTIVPALAISAALSGTVYAQETREPARAENRDDGIDLGWLGLLGLAGLFGLKRREHEYDSRDRDRVAVNPR